MTETQKNRADLKLLRYIIHSNSAFKCSEDWYLQDFCYELCPSYECLSHYVISHTLLDSEVSSVHLYDVDVLIKLERIATFLIDGWDDNLWHSLYGSVASQVDELPLILGLANLTGHCGNAEKIFQTALQAMKNKGIEEA
ncbi:hypothetical protein VNI00_017329 [Paramarasmius palmivorus]|uniref:Uncharacterized protein n=1 Tax=Paramarasmius palmivorus TaxID=297713 RepID=A0AAW0B7B3_9AGAR